MSHFSKQLGDSGEREARDYLVGKGFRFLEANFRARGGEVDLIMEDGEVLVFVEVKTRRSSDYGDPEEAVTSLKGAHMIKAALSYIKLKGIRERMLRFDVIALSEKGIRHIPNAIESSGSYYY